MEIPLSAETAEKLNRLAAYQGRESAEIVADAVDVLIQDTVIQIKHAVAPVTKPLAQVGVIAEELTQALRAESQEQLADVVQLLAWGEAEGRIRRNAALSQLYAAQAKLQPPVDLSEVFGSWGRSGHAVDGLEFEREQRDEW